jgi:hypothetical protein
MMMIGEMSCYGYRFVVEISCVWVVMGANVPMCDKKSEAIRVIHRTNHHESRTNGIECISAPDAWLVACLVVGLFVYSLARVVCCGGVKRFVVVLSCEPENLLVRVSVWLGLE